MKIQKVGVINFKGVAIFSNVGSVDFLMTLDYDNYHKDDYTDLIAPIIVGKGDEARPVDLDVSFHTELFKRQTDTPTNMNLKGGFTDKEESWMAPYMFKNHMFLATTDFWDNLIEE